MKAKIITSIALAVLATNVAADVKTSWSGEGSEVQTLSVYTKTNQGKLQHGLLINDEGQIDLYGTTGIKRHVGINAVTEQEYSEREKKQKKAIKRVKKAVQQNSAKLGSARVDIDNNSANIQQNSESIQYTGKALNRHSNVLANHYQIIRDNTTKIASNSSRINNLENSIEVLQGDVYSGFAMSSALAGLGKAHKGKIALSVALGNYSGATGLAVGISGNTGNWDFNAGLAKSGNKEMINTGATFNF